MRGATTGGASSYLPTFRAVLSQLLTLAAQVAGVLLGGAAVAAAVHGGVDPRRLRLGAALAAAGALLVFTVAQARPTADGLKEVSEARPTGGLRSGVEECAAERSLDIGFLRFLREELPEDARYQLVLSDLQLGRTSDFCIDLNLLPRIHVRELSNADYIVFYESVPQGALDEARAFGAGELVLFDEDNQDLAYLELTRGDGD